MFRSFLASATLSGLLFLTTPASHAQTAPAPALLKPAAKDVLEQVIAAQNALTGLSATIVVTGVELDGTPIRGKTITLAFQRPNLAKVTVSGPSGPLQQISTDGVTATTFSVPEKRYTSEVVPSTFLLVFVVLSKPKAIMPSLLGPDFLTGFLTNLMDQPGTTANTGLSSTLGGVAVDTLVITTPLDSSAKQSSAKIKITLAFGHDDHLLRQFTEFVTGTRDGKVQSLTYTETVTSLTVNPPLSTADFVFTPPPGVKKVNRQTRPPKHNPRLMPGSPPLRHHSQKPHGPVALAKS